MQAFAKLSLVAAAATSLTGALAAPLDAGLGIGIGTPAQVISQCTVPNTVALTFNDGPYIYTKDIVNTLDAAGTKGTFFVNGDNWDCIYNNADNLKYAYDHGHQIASHTWSHKDLSTLSWDQIQDEMRLVDEAIQKITGATPAFMRPPYGSYNDQVRSAAGVRGQKIVLWDFDSGDSTGASVEQSKQKYDETVNQRPSTVLALNHEVYETTAHQVLPYAIEKLQGAGYRLVTLAECLGQQPYQSVGNPAPRDACSHSRLSLPLLT